MRRSIAICTCILVICGAAHGERRCKADEFVETYYTFSVEFQNLWKEIIVTDPSDEAKADILNERLTDLQNEIIDFSRIVTKCRMDRVSEIYDGRTSLFEDEEYRTYQSIYEPLYYMGLATIYSSRYFSAGEGYYLDLARRMQEMLRDQEQKIKGH